MARIYIDSNYKKIYLEKEFMEKASVFGSKEFEDITELRYAFPDYKIIRCDTDDLQKKVQKKILENCFN